MKDFVGFIAAPRRRNPLNIRHPTLARVVYVLHTLVGLVVASLGLWLCWWAPSTSAKENSYWSGLTVSKLPSHEEILSNKFRFFIYIFSWCFPESLAWSWSVSNDCQDINCVSICSHSFESIPHSSHSWRPFAHWSHPHSPLCIWWISCRRTLTVVPSTDSTPIQSAHVTSIAMETVPPQPYRIMGNSLAASPTGEIRTENGFAYWS